MVKYLKELFLPLGQNRVWLLQVILQIQMPPYLNCWHHCTLLTYHSLLWAKVGSKCLLQEGQPFGYTVSAPFCKNGVWPPCLSNFYIFPTVHIYKTPLKVLTSYYIQSKLLYLHLVSLHYCILFCHGVIFNKFPRVITIMGEGGFSSNVRNIEIEAALALQCGLQFCSVSAVYTGYIAGTLCML